MHGCGIGIEKKVNGADGFLCWFTNDQGYGRVWETAYDFIDGRHGGVGAFKFLTLIKSS